MIKCDRGKETIRIEQQDRKETDYGKWSKMDRRAKTGNIWERQ